MQVPVARPFVFRTPCLAIPPALGVLGARFRWSMISCAVMAVLGVVWRDYAREARDPLWYSCISAICLRHDPDDPV